MLRITRENVNMVKRIQSKKSDMSNEKMERDWQQNLKFIDNISAFPEDWYIRRANSDPELSKSHRESNRKTERKSHRDRSGSRSHSPNDDSANRNQSRKPAAAQQKPTQKSSVAPKQLTTMKYEVEVKTCSDMGAGTDANIKIALVGGGDKTVEFPFDKNSAVSMNNDIFETGKVDKFEFNGNNVGKLKKITIASDGKGLTSDWKLEYVKVIAAKDSYT